MQTLRCRGSQLVAKARYSQRSREIMKIAWKIS